MKQYRVFISINFPEGIKKKLADFQKKLPELPVKWTKLNNIHITLAFIGSVRDEELLDICKITKKVVSRHASFFVNLNKICYGPPKKMPPRMIWAEGEKSQEVAALKADLEKSLLSSGNVSFSPENRAFSPHVTLGRIRQWEWRKIEPEERPEIDEEIKLSFSVDSIEVMESQLKRGGAEYTVLESAPLS